MPTDADRARSDNSPAWITFDCYGTLIDWNGGIRAELDLSFAAQAAPRLLQRYYELEPPVQPKP